MATDTGTGSDPNPPSDAEPGRPVEFWPTAAIRSALHASDDISTWQRIVSVVKRDPYGRTARQVEEVLDGTQPYGIARALAEVLEQARNRLEDDERAEVAREISALIESCTLSRREFASRAGVNPANLDSYLAGSVSPPASLMVRMRRLAERFAHRPPG